MSKCPRLQRNACNLNGLLLLGYECRCTIGMRFFTVAAFLCGLISTAGASANESASKRLVLPSDFTPPPVFKNINLLKNINLEKGYVRESVNVVIENVDKKDQDEYYIAFSTEHFSKVGGLEVHNKNAPEEGKFEVIKPEINPSRSVNG